MKSVYFPETGNALNISTLQNPEIRASEILNALIVQTSQQDYDEVTVNKLIIEYESLRS
jgi:hypothetical protein